MVDEPELSPTGDPGSSDDETVKGDRESDHIAEILEEVKNNENAPESASGNGTAIRNRYRDLIADAQDSTSEDGSTEALPRRAGSPIESLLSIPDDSPSVQV